ncbi:MAG: cytochrome P450 [Cyanobacteriota bacterium]
MSKEKKNFRLPPGPTKKLLGFENLVQIRRNTINFLQKNIKKYGHVFTFEIGKNRLFYIQDPEIIKEILVTHNNNFIKGRVLEAAKEILGEGLLTNNDHQSHLRQRRMIQPAFHHKRITYYSQIMIDYTYDFFEKWKNNETLIINEEMMQLTLKIVCKALFEAEMKYDIKKIEEALSIFLERAIDVNNPLAYLTKNFPTRKNRKFFDAKKYLDQTIDQMVEDRKDDAIDRNDLLSMMIIARDEGHKMNTTQIRDETMTLFLAGHETTANAITWTLYLLSLNPEKEEKMYNEIKTVLGNRKATPEDLVNLVYTRKVLAESMRLYPPAWIIARRALEDLELKDYTIPAKSICLMSQYLMHKDNRFYEDSESFIPERWTEEFKEKLPKFAYFPFGGGARVCIGEQFAWSEGILLLSILLQKWKFNLIPDQKIELHQLITLRPKNGIKMEIEERK